MATQAEIKNLYTTYLGRPADTDGLNYWSQYPGNLADVTRAFVGAANSEFQSRRQADRVPCLPGRTARLQLLGASELRAGGRRAGARPQPAVPGRAAVLTGLTSSNH